MRTLGAHCILEPPNAIRKKTQVIIILSYLPDSLESTNSIRKKTQIIIILSCLPDSNLHPQYPINGRSYSYCLFHQRGQAFGSTKIERTMLPGRKRNWSRRSRDTYSVRTNPWSKTAYDYFDLHLMLGKRIRGGVHETSRKTGRWVKDQEHITFSFKTQALKDEKKVRSVHVYTKGPGTYKFDSAIPTDPLPDNITDYLGKRVWPANLNAEGILYF